VASEFSHNNFHARRGRAAARGLHHYCKECSNANVLKWRLNNQEKVARYEQERLFDKIEWQQEYYKKHKEKQLLYQAEYRKKHREKINANFKAKYWKRKEKLNEQKPNL
jgi:hypothetical protein